MNKLIDTISLPAGLRDLSVKQLEQVAKELRDELIENVSQSGGHFASSLGATEITVALHAVFNTPEDRLVFDVGHQGYIHKMLTGRRDRMHTIRQKDGLSGFLHRDESEYDCFGAGHAGTSVSAALGMAEALSQIDPDRKAIAIIGDGSISAGMALEALNHAGALKKNLIVVLNDNDMSISPNVGAMSWLFSRAATAKLPTKARHGFKKMHEKGYVPDFVYRSIDRAEEAAKGYFCEPAGWFESFGIRYIGPVDGHSIDSLVTALEHAKDQDGPVLVHARTTKGKGYEPAEEDPLTWHGVTPFNPKTATFNGSTKKPTKSLPSYSAVFADALSEIANDNKDIVAITAAMPTGTGLDRFEKVHPDKFYDVAICEQHAVTFAAGLACEGKVPVCAIYSTFLQRGYDQVVHDVCIQNLPVVFAMDRAGPVGNDGHTHQGIYDISFLRCLPNITLMAPKDENELRNMLYTATNHNGPTGVRFPRGKAFGVEIDDKMQNLPIGKGEIVKDGSDAVIVALGTQVYTALAVAERLEKEKGLSIAVINPRFIKPLDHELFSSELPRFQTICTIEDNVLMGGFGSALIELINDEQIVIQKPIKRFGVNDAPLDHASQSEQYEMCGYDPESIYNFIATNTVAGLKAVNA